MDLKQSTAVTIKLGPFLDDTDGKTAEVGLTIKKADVRLSKNGGDMAAANADQGESDAGAAHDELGWYDISLNTTDTNTLGRLQVIVHESGALPVFAEFMVQPSNVWDSLYGADKLQTDVVEVSGDSTAADNLEAAYDGTGYNVGGGQVVVASVSGGVTLADDAITAATFDGTTAFPVTSADDGVTALARVGEYSEALATLAGDVEELSELVGGITSGSGEYEVVLTIRTTDGSAVAGATVWVNSENDRSGSVVRPAPTDDGGKVTFWLNGTTYWVFCRLSGYSFTIKTITPSTGNTGFELDIATAISTGEMSFYADSFLSRAIKSVRENLDEPVIRAKYKDDRIVELLEEAYILVFNEKNRQSKTPAVVKQVITPQAGVTAYVLPHVMGSFYGLYSAGPSGTRVYYDGRGRQNPMGQRVWLEGNTLNIQMPDVFGPDAPLIAEWIPSGIARLHNGVCEVSADGKEVKFGPTPNAGVLDTHVSAYAGSVLRILGVDGTSAEGNYLQERIISAYDNGTRTATLDVALDPVPTTDDGHIYYEIAPAIYKGMDTVVALYAAYRIMAIEGNQKRAGGLLAAYRDAIRNVRLTEYYSNMPEAPMLRGDNWNNRRYRPT